MKWFKKAVKEKDYSSITMKIISTLDGTPVAVQCQHIERKDGFKNEEHKKNCKDMLDKATKLINQIAESEAALRDKKMGDLTVKEHTLAQMYGKNIQEIMNKFEVKTNCFIAEQGY